MRYSPKNHKWAVIQSGYCVFGTGRTAESAKLDAIKWMEFNREDETGEPYTIKQGMGEMADLDACLVNRSERVDGSFYLTDDPADIKSYVENQ